jgi:hypothetical protein
MHVREQGLTRVFKKLNFFYLKLIFILVFLNRFNVLI